MDSFMRPATTVDLLNGMQVTNIRSLISQNNFYVNGGQYI